MTFAQIITGKFVPPGLDKLRNEGKAEGLAQGIVQGMAQGEMRGRAAAYAEFRDWLNRREAAIARGEPFCEPAPDEVGNLSDAGTAQRACRPGVCHRGSPSDAGAAAARLG